MSLGRVTLYACLGDTSEETLRKKSEKNRKRMSGSYSCVYLLSKCKGYLQDMTLRPSLEAAEKAQVRRNHSGHGSPGHPVGVSHIDSVLRYARRALISATLTVYCCMSICMYAQPAF